MSHLWWPALASLWLSMFFVLLRAGIRSYSAVKLEDRLVEIDRLNLLEKFLRNEHSLLALVTALGNLFAMAYVLLVTLWIASLEGVWQITGAILLAAALLLIFSAAIPLPWGRYSSERIIAQCIRPLFVLRTVFWPLIHVLDLFDVLVRRLIGVPNGNGRDSALEDELMAVVKEGELEGTLEEDEKEMIESIIHFRDTDVAAIMTPRTDMACLPRTATMDEAREFVMAEGHSRIPIFEETMDVIVGVLYAKDVLAATRENSFGSRTVSDIMRSPLFVPETKKVTDLLKDFQHAGVHLAIVLDEYGGTAGLVSIEDIIEEIVGDIVDEYDEEEPSEWIRRTSATSADLDARTRINEVNDTLDIELPEDEDYDTVGGFVLSQLGHIPQTGESLEYQGLTITVISAEARKISQLRIDGLDKFQWPQE